MRNSLILIADRLQVLSKETGEILPPDRHLLLYAATALKMAANTPAAAAWEEMQEGARRMDADAKLPAMASAAPPQRERDLALVSWVMLYATEGGQWPSAKTISEPLIKLAGHGRPTQLAADCLKSGLTLKGLLSIAHLVKIVERDAE